MNLLQKPFACIAACAGLLFVSGCGGCPAVYIPPSLELEPAGFVVNAPGQLKLRSDGLLGNQCTSSSASEVAFYADGFRLGEDRQAPFEFTWNLVPGQGVVPASGSKDVFVYAVTNIPGLVETRKFQIRITVTTP